MTYRLSPTTLRVLRELDVMERERARERAIEQAFDYTRDGRVELHNLESRGDAASVLNPLVSRRSASSRLRR